MKKKKSLTEGQQEQMRAIMDAFIARRKQLGMSQAALAARAGLTREHLSVLELGKFYPSLSVVICIAEALGMSLSLTIRDDSL